MATKEVVRLSPRGSVAKFLARVVTVPVCFFLAIYLAIVLVRRFPFR